MPNLSHPDPHKEEFCQRRAMAIFTKEDPYDSWLEVYGDDDEREEAKQRTSCSRLMANQEVKNRISQIGMSVIAKQENRIVYTAEKLMDFCVDVITSPPSAASMDNPNCELRMSKQGPYPAFPDKMQAAALFAKIKGLAQDVNVHLSIPSWSPTSEANICEPLIEGEVVQESPGPLPDAPQDT